MLSEKELLAQGTYCMDYGAPDKGEFFGDQGQQQLERRADLLWQIIHDDPRFQSHGRGVALAEATDENVADQIAVARLIGACACEAVPAAELPSRMARLEAAGLATDWYLEWRSGADAQDAARAALVKRPLPADLTLRVVDAHTSTETMASLNEVTQTCEVLLPNGAFMRGLRRPAICLYAEDSQGKVVGTSAAVAAFHPSHPRAGCAWWGLLSTDPERRGAGIALHLGARALIEMQERYGINEVYTGIRPGNGPSEALCSKLGLRPTESFILLAIATEVLGTGRVTK